MNVCFIALLISINDFFSKFQGKMEYVQLDKLDSVFDLLFEQLEAFGKDPVKYTNTNKIQSCSCNHSDKAIQNSSKYSDTVNQNSNKSRDTINQNPNKQSDKVNQNTNECSDTVNQNPIKYCGTVSQNPNKYSDTVNQNPNKYCGTVSQNPNKYSDTVNQNPNKYSGTVNKYSSEHSDTVYHKCSKNSREDMSDIFSFKKEQAECIRNRVAVTNKRNDLVLSSRRDKTILGNTLNEHRHQKKQCIPMPLQQGNSKLSCINHCKDDNTAFEGSEKQFERNIKHMKTLPASDVTVPDIDATIDQLKNEPNGIKQVPQNNVMFPSQQCPVSESSSILLQKGQQMPGQGHLGKSCYCCLVLFVFTRKFVFNRTNYNVSEC